MLTTKGFTRLTHDELKEMFFESAREILGREVNLNDHSGLGMLLQTVAWVLAEIEEREEVSFQNMNGTTAEGLALDLFWRSFGKSRQQGTYARGLLEIKGDDDTVVPAGFIVATADGFQYKTIEDTTIKQGQAVVIIESIEQGQDYNKDIGEVTEIINPILGVDSVFNTSEIKGGLDIETDEEFRERALLEMREPTTGSNDAQYRVWARQVEGVGSVKVLPVTPQPGYATIIITDRNGEAADEILIKEVQDYIDKLKDVNAGIIVESAVSKMITVSVNIKLSKTADLQIINESIEKDIEEYLRSTALKEDYVSYAKIGNIILSTEGVLDYEDLKLNDTIGNIEIAERETATLKEFKVGVM